MIEEGVSEWPWFSRDAAEAAKHTSGVPSSQQTPFFSFFSNGKMSQLSDFNTMLQIFISCSPLLQNIWILSGPLVANYPKKMEKYILQEPKVRDFRQAYLASVTRTFASFRDRRSRSVGADEQARSRMIVTAYFSLIWPWPGPLTFFFLGRYQIWLFLLVLLLFFNSTPREIELLTSHPYIFN